MTLDKLKTRCENAGFKYAYGKFKQPTPPPHLVAITVDTDNFMADNKVYYGPIPIQLDYTYIVKDLEAQEKIENELNIINTENVLKNSKNPNELKEIFNKIEDNYNIKITNYNEELYKKGFIDGVNLILNCLEK